MRDRFLNVAAVAGLALLSVLSGGPARADTVAQIESTSSKLVFQPVVEAA